jgi:hypothetical protein
MNLSDHDRLARLHWWRGFLACLSYVALSVTIGCAFALGWMFQQGGGWR